MSSEITADNK